MTMKPRGRRAAARRPLIQQATQFTLRRRPARHVAGPRPVTRPAPDTVPTQVTVQLADLFGRSPAGVR